MSSLLADMAAMTGIWMGGAALMAASVALKQSFGVTARPHGAPARARSAFRTHRAFAAHT
ncbi:MAG TPA: hypothetical protein VFE05_24485 [Longimicrobiaceae bacterium]|jgi:hypothetical protein|nr:hypothetical protein [Longimicrobiaceae bacterium]